MMKKLLSITFVLCIILSFAAVPSFAYSEGDVVDQMDYYNDAAEDLYLDTLPQAQSSANGPITRATRDLSASSYSINWTVPAENSLYSADYYKTNSEQIVIKLKGDTTTSVTVKLYSANGTAQTITKNITTISKNFTFSGLTASTTYYFKIINNDQHDVSVTGSISQ